MRPLLLGVAIVLMVSASAAAQPYLGSSTPHGGSIEIGGSAMWTGGYDAGSQVAFESPNSGTGPPLTLFTTSSDVAAAIGVDARVGVYLGRRVAVEGTFQFSRPVLQTNITDDFENAAPITAKETLSSYIAGGTLLFHFGTGRVVPFVAGGAGYVRQLHEDNADVLTGAEVHGGGGIKIWLGTGARRFGLRVDAGASSRTKSVAFEQKRRVLPVAGFGFSYLF